LKEIRKLYAKREKQNAILNHEAFLIDKNRSFLQKPHATWFGENRTVDEKIIFKRNLG